MIVSDYFWHKYQNSYYICNLIIGPNNTSQTVATQVSNSPSIAACGLKPLATLSGCMVGNAIEEYYDRYVEGWNNHDPETVMEAFADGGTVSDPATDGTLSGDEIRGWVEETTEGFPDVRFEVDRRSSDEEAGRLFVEWTMYGTHDGPFGPLPPTGESVELSGVDVITFSEDGITSIDGYFDMTEFKEELGLSFPAVIGKLPKLATGAVKQAV
jgi:steroid delta-isomerase-like uncharacterized protein